MLIIPSTMSLALSTRKTIKIIISIAILLVLLCLPGIVFHIEHTNILDLLYALMVPLFILLIPLVIFRRLIRLYAALMAIFILLAPMVTFPIIYFGLPVKKDMLLIVFNTTYQEASELLRGYLPILIITYAAYIIFIILAIKWLPSKVSFKRSIIISVIALFSLIGITVIRYGYHPLIHNIKGMTYNYYPFHLIRVSYLFYKEEASVKKAEKNVKNLYYKNVAHLSSAKRQVYVLFIGESARYDHWEINGYYRATSPLLMQQKNLIAYHDAVASGCLTELAVPQILTGVTADHYTDHLHQAGILRLFHQAGFKTYWISSQTDYGNIRMHANLADSTIWMQNVFRSNKHMHYDMELINRMKAIFKKDTGNCLLVIHPLGSHFNFIYRYPKTFEHFKPVWHSNSFIPTQGDKKTQLINAYDNTILYTDAVIDSAIKVIDSLHCISAMLYASDHGENLYDDSRHLIFHAPNTPSIYLAHIPLFIYGSQEYIQEFPIKWKYLNAHTNSKISNNQIFETLTDMAGINYKGKEPSNSFASKSFKSSSQRILGPNSKVYQYSELK